MHPNPLIIINRGIVHVGIYLASLYVCRYFDLVHIMWSSMKYLHTGSIYKFNRWNI
jgi:hypothetical protein